MTNRRQALWMVVAVCVAITVATLSTAAIVSAVQSTQIRDTQAANTETLDSSQRTLQIVQDCTTPGGDCYVRAQKQTASAVADINRVVILAAACASGIPRSLPVATRQDRIQSCVINRLSADR